MSALGAGYSGCDVDAGAALIKASHGNAYKWPAILARFASELSNIDTEAVTLLAEHIRKIPWWQIKKDNDVHGRIEPPIYAGLVKCKKPSFVQKKALELLACASPHEWLMEHFDELDDDDDVALALSIAFNLVKEGPFLGGPTVRPIFMPPVTQALLAAVYAVDNFRTIGKPIPLVWIKKAVKLVQLAVNQKLERQASVLKAFWFTECLSDTALMADKYVASYEHRNDDGIVDRICTLALCLMPKGRTVSIQTYMRFAVRSFVAIVAFVYMVAYICVALAYICVLDRIRHRHRHRNRQRHRRHRNRQRHCRHRHRNQQRQRHRRNRQANLFDISR